MSKRMVLKPVPQPLEHLDGATVKRESWRPIHAGEAFQRSHSFSRQLLAQRLYYAAVRSAQKAAATAALGHPPGRQEPMLAKAQLGQLYSDLPARFAAQAGIGHTAFMEFDRRVQSQPIASQLGVERMKALHESSFQAAAPDLKAFLRLAALCTNALDQRLTLRSLARERGLAAVEHYRVFLAAQQPMPPTTTGQMVRALVLFADLLQPLVDRTLNQLHPHLQLQYRAAASVVRIREPLFDQVCDSEVTRFMVDYGEQLIATLGSFLPPPQPILPRIVPQRGQEAHPAVRERMRRLRESHPELRPLLEGVEQPDNDELDKRTVAPLDAPPPPPLEEGDGSPAANLANQVAPGETLSVEARTALASLQNDLRRVLKEANDERGLAADPRPEQIERMLRNRPFSAGTLEGNPTLLAEVDRVLGWDDETQGGAVFQEVLIPPEDDSPYQALRREAAPLIARLRRLVYPDTSRRPVRQRYCRSGSPDPSRLPLFQLSDVIYRRNEQRRKPTDQVHGRSCVLLACDASGSMQSGELALLKLLTCAFAEALYDARGVTVLAGAYHSAVIGDAAEAPAVKWLLHPRLTPAVSPRQAAQAVTALPESGTGVNRDALSLTYMLDEARAVAPRATCYLINLTDGKFNSRDRGGNGTREMEAFLEAAHDLPDGALHYTVVAIGKPDNYQLSGADRIITVPNDMLTDRPALVERIAAFVARTLGQERGGPSPMEVTP